MLAEREDNTDELSLAGDFPAVTREQWLDLVAGVIGKGLANPTPEELARRFESRLVTHTYDGVRIEPLYDRQDVADLPDPGLPGSSPFVRGRRPLGGWDACQRVEVGSHGRPAGAAVAELEGGATSLWLGLLDAPSVDKDALGAALEGVLLDMAPVRLDAGSRGAEAADALFAVWTDRGVDPRRGSAGLGLDPLALAASTGDFGSGLDDQTAQATALALRAASAYSGVRTVVANGTVYHEAGGSDSEELGCSLAAGVAHLRSLTDAGMGIDAAYGQIEVRLAATADQFSTTAKLRASRRLWSKVGEVIGVRTGTPVPPTHAVTSRAMLSVYDPWVNLLRTTVACLSAGVGGADAVTVLPYDYLSTGPGSSPMGRRLARNIHALLLEESHLGAVVDLAGGSWYVETLTDALARQAWAWFQEIERAGGMRRALSAGLVQDRLNATWAARADHLAKGIDPLTGVSEFPNVDEPAPDPAALAAALDEGSGPPLSVPRRRYAARFEALRGRADRETAARGHRPAVLAATLGTAAVFTARATFAQNLFGVAGLRTIQAGEPDWGGILAQGDVRLACICSDDATYAEHAADAARALKAAGATWVYLAGRPGDDRQAWEDAGVDEFVYLGVDRLAVLSRALEKAGVA